MIKFISLFFLLVSAAVCAQDSDFGAWTGLAVEYNYKDFSVNLEAESRFSNNLSSVEKVFIEPSISYKLLPFASLGAGMRYGTEYELDEQNGENSVRYYGSVELSAKYSYFKFSLKSKYQRDVNKLYKSPAYEYADVFRNKIGGKYIFKGTPFRFGASAELFLPLSEEELLFNKYRTLIYYEYYISSKLKLKNGFIYQSEINQATPQDKYIVSLSLLYKIK